MQHIKHVDLETLSNIIETIPSNIFFKDKDLKYVFSSHYWEQIDASSDEFDIYGKSDRDIRKDTYNLDNVDESDRAILSCGEGKQYTIKADVDGNTQYLNIMKEPVKDKDGNIIGIVGLINDVSQAMDEVNVKYREAAEEAERAANMKTDFLANMSHEIRTPMNAIIGMTEMALRENLPPAAREYLAQIKSSGNTLLNIINDILDFSKIESGKMDIITEKYEPLAVMRDLLSVFMTRLQDKNVELICTINPDMPRGLIGDSVRIKQVVINLVNNAIKFTNHGFVHIDLDYEDKGNDEIDFNISVIDTGIGIKKEEIDKLFDPFSQLNTKRNRTIEGTGLGLAIVSRLLELMDGKIEVTSEYEKGSCFKVTIPQAVYDNEQVAAVEEPENKAVIGYWKSANGEDKFYEILKRFNVDTYNLTAIYNYDELIKEHEKELEGKRQFLFTTYKIYKDELVEFADRNRHINFIVICDYFSKLPEREANVRFLKKPYSTMGIVYALNNKSFAKTDTEQYEFDFIAPDAKVLFVDDNEINLDVSEGIVEPLKMQVVKAASGLEALKYLENETFDIVFMDHMMPELDGVQTTKIIRKLHPELKDMPIIALTANAVGEVKDMFLREGMNDFVAKPIEVKAFISKIRHWLPEDKIIARTVSDSKQSNEEVREKLAIGDLDTEAAISLIGNEKLYLTVLNTYYKSIRQKAELIRKYEMTGDINAYTIEVHALKSSSKQVGAMELSDMAAKLEACGKNGDVNTIHAETDQLINKYLEYADVLSAVFDNENEKTKAKNKISITLLSSLLDRMAEAADNLDMDEMENVVSEMDEYLYDAEEEGLFAELKEAVSNIDVETVSDIVGRWKALNNSLFP